jgi:hypothetical protein
MDQKFSALIDRLEKLVERQEAATGSATGIAVLSVSPGSVAPIVKAWQKEVICKVQCFKDATAALNIAQVTDASNLFVELVNLQSAVLTTMSKFQKPD